ncbi:hypothetical protein GCM10007198_03520 [Microbacterium aerolatum]|nr:hypothetical protein GCM10007198_03520 [Microbacterium aerolatum]
MPQRELLLDGVTYVLAASPSAEQYLHQKYPKYRAKFSSERIGTPAAINPGNASRKALHIVSCSYISPVKRLKMLIDNLAEAQTSRGILVTWTHIGPGSGAYAEEVFAHATCRLASGTFSFLGHMGNRELHEWYANNPATVFVQMSESEGGLAASIQEALAQGLPVIVTDVGGVGELRQDARLFPGLLDANHTPAQFADRLVDLLSSDDESYQRYVGASMEYWRVHCSASTLASGFARRLRQIATETSVGYVSA